jgi:hypothetical protein
MEGEYANEKVMEKLPGYSTTECWGTTETLTKPNIADGWKKSVDFVDFSGHGSPASWATHPPHDDHTWIPPGHWMSDYPYWLYADFDIFRLNNAYKYPVVFYNSCSNNKFTKSATCLGWYTLAKPGGGGIATFAASGIGYGVPGNEVARRMGWMEVHCFDELYKTKQLGQVWHNCIEDYYTTFEGDLDGIDYKTMLELEMFGDPTLVIEDGDDPRSIPVYTPVLPRLLDRLVDTFPRLANIFKLILEMLA